MPRDVQRFRKTYSYYRPKPQEVAFGAGGGVTEEELRGLDWKQSVRAATTTNITLSPAPASIDGVTLTADSRVLVKNQTSASANGIYFYDSGTGDLVRSLDAVDPALTSAAAVFVESGATNGGCSFVLTTQDPITVGSTAQTWVKFAGTPSVYTRDLHFLAGTVASSAASGTMESVGMVYFDPSEFPQGTKTVKFTAILSPTFGTTAYMDVYDYSGIVAVPPGPVSGSVLTGSTSSYTYLSKEIVSLENASSPGIIEARIWCSPNGAGFNAICKSAKLEVKVE